jgi:hypothetical protein
VNRLLRLTLLAPDIQEAILEARQSKGLQLKELTRAMPSEWEEQRKWLRAPGHNELTGIGPANIAKRLGACWLAASCLWFS